MKKVFILLISVLILFSFAACSPAAKGPVEPTADDRAVMKEIGDAYSVMMASGKLTTTTDGATTTLTLESPETFSGVKFDKAIIKLGMGEIVTNNLDFDCTTKDGKRHTVKMNVEMKFTTQELMKAEMILDGKMLTVGKQDISFIPGIGKPSTP